MRPEIPMEPDVPSKSDSLPVKEIVSGGGGLLDSFWALADLKDVVREDAIVSLLRQIHASEDVTTTLEYVLNRLVRGLSSSHKAARLGFYTALVHLLRLFAVVEPLECIRLVKKHHRSTVEDGGNSHASVGLCLGYAALVRSRRLHEHPEVMQQVASELLSRCATETFREMCTTLLVEMVHESDESVFESRLWPSFRTHFESGWEDCTCEKLWLVLVCSQKYPKLLNKNYLKKVWGGSSSLLHGKSHEAVAKIFLRSSSSHPRVHPVCPAVLRALSSSSFDSLMSFWEIFTDLAFGKQQRKEKAYLAFELLKGLLDEVLNTEASVECVRRLLLPCFVRSLVLSLVHPQVVLHGATVKLANALVSFVSTTDDALSQVEVVKCLLLPPGSFSFDQVTHSSTIASMISTMKVDAVRGLIVFVKDAFLESDAVSETHRSSALHLLSRTVGISPIARADLDMQIDVLQFLALHAFFDHVSESSEIPQCGRRSNGVSAALHDKARNGLLACIASLSARGLNGPTKDKSQTKDGSDTSISIRRRLHLDVLHSVFVYVDRLLQSTRVVSPVLDECRRSKVHEAFGEAVRTVQEIRDGGTMTSDRPESQAFQLLFVHLGIHLLVDTTDATMTALKDVHVCYGKLYGPRRSTDEPDWILVIVDLLLELLASTSQVGRMRSVVRDVFALLVDPHLTVDALDHILDVVDPESIADDDDEASNTDDERESDDDGEESSSEDDDEDATEKECNGTLRDSVKAALGNAADDSEQDDSDSDGVVLDDDAMMQLDETLAEAFRSVLVKKPSRPSAQLDEETVHFRHRCFDLIDAVISLRPSVPFLLRLIVPMVSTVEYALKDKVQVSVGQKALACLRRVCRVKRLLDERIDGDSPLAGKDGLATILRELVARFRKVSDYETSLVIAEACTFVVRCALHADRQREPSSSETKNRKPDSEQPQRHRKRKHTDETSEQQVTKAWHVDECIEIYRQTLRDYFDNRERHTPHQMFTCLVKKYLHLGWQLADVLQNYAFRPEVRLFKRTRAVTMLLLLMSNPNLVVQVVGADHWSNISDDIQLKITESLKVLTTNFKPRCVAELCHLTANLATLDRKYGRPLSTDSWRAISDAVERLFAVKDLPKDAKKNMKRVRTVLSRRSVEAECVPKRINGRESTSDGEPPPTGKVKKLRKSPEDSS